MLDQSVSAFLDQIAAEEPAPGGGAVAAVVTAMAAGLVGMGARFSRKHWDGWKPVAAEADELRERVAPLAQADADAFAEYLAAIRLPKDDQERDQAVAQATARASAVPLEIAAAAARVADLAAALAENGNPNLKDDAVSAALFAEAAARATANLVAANLGRDDDERVIKARRYAVDASGAAEEALAATT
jgi:formiminotetrahydrofolate cyclodeaminase